LGLDSPGKLRASVEHERTIPTLEGGLNLIIVQANEGPSTTNAASAWPWDFHRAISISVAVAAERAMAG
jgi:hypothetical protein